MKTAEPLNPCPYPGLRSFTEEESLYFKGRDAQVDQLSALLEKNKFLMVTGASGEGKSSLIYAGLLPNARAGFFRAKYSNWVVAAFRPERNPVSSVARSLAAQFSLNADTVETEIRRGFSSLIDLYCSSPFYSAGDDAPGNELTDKEKGERKRKSANLLIVVDQFEEFFTNPENFSNESPSTDAQIVINLLLETARIALDRDLPVYVVCTMRSDYIGQCSAFRGLPEFIGFSQFFVPRLKRKDLKQVIEEPAILSGNRISQRLIERLVYDIAEGVDQLPMLQHALSQIWMRADRGNEEMDLLHYAMAGGMPAVDLPDTDRERFDNWLSGLPENQRHFYIETGLGKVIEIHANQLYENAWSLYNAENPGRPLRQQDAKRVIALTFSCLTKIDNSRAVRNRMSLEEISAIINMPAVDAATTGRIIDIYRAEGNSFIHPFRSADPATQVLPPDTVLDITHESLIRNWNKLNQWANTEFEFYSTWLDFKKQLDRWKDSGRSSGYLLPIGPLTYFENWYANCKPNAGWIMRYSGQGENNPETQKTAEKELEDTRDFLKRSARKEMVSRTVMKYGPGRIAAVFAIGIMLLLSGYYWYNAEQKRNSNVLKTVRTDSQALLNSKEVSDRDKGTYLIAEERLDSGILLPYLAKLDFRNRVALSTEVFKQLTFFSLSRPLALKDSLFRHISEDLLSADTLPANRGFLLSACNSFLAIAAMDIYYHYDKTRSDLLAAIADRDYGNVMHFYSSASFYKPTVPPDLNMAIHWWLTMGKPHPVQVRAMLRLISPREATDSGLVFHTYYAKGNAESDGRADVDYNGGYLTLASLYAAVGEATTITNLFAELLRLKQRDYFELPRLTNNHLNVIGYLYRFGYRDKVKEVVDWVAANTEDNSAVTTMRNLVMRSGYISRVYSLNTLPGSYRSYRGNFFPNLYFCPRENFDAMTEDYETEIRKVQPAAESRFQLAMNDKRKAMFYAKYWYDRGLPVDSARLDGWLDEAMNLFGTLDDQFLATTQSVTTVYNLDGVRTGNVTKRNLFIYPDYRDGWFAAPYHTDYFFSYLLRKNLLDKIYRTGEDLQALQLWLVKAYEWFTRTSPGVLWKQYELPENDLTAMLDFINRHPEGKSFDRNRLCLILANDAFEHGDPKSGMTFYKQINPGALFSSANAFEYLEKIFFANRLNDLMANLAENGSAKEAEALMHAYMPQNQQADAYMKMAGKLFRKDQDPELFRMLDSADRKIEGSNFALLQQTDDPHAWEILQLSAIGGRALNQKADEMLRNIYEQNQFFGVVSRTSGVAEAGNFHDAYTGIPASLTETEDLQCRMRILVVADRKAEKSRNDRSWETMDRFLDWSWNYITYIGN